MNFIRDALINNINFHFKVKFFIIFFKFYNFNLIKIYFFKLFVFLLYYSLNLKAE